MQHSFVVSADDEDVFIEIHLAPLPFWKRVGNAIRYILGKRSPYGDFEEVLLSPADALDLSDRLVKWTGGEGVQFTPNDVY
jgi:hypothetical protein